jgi:hypothetical protein
MAQQEGVLVQGNMGEKAGRSRFLAEHLSGGDVSLAPEMERWMAKSLDELAYEHADTAVGGVGVLRRVASAFRGTKVLGSITAYPRNFWGALQNGMMMGLNPTKAFRSSNVAKFKASLKDSLGLPIGADDAALVDYLRGERIIDDSARNSDAVYHIEAINNMFASGLSGKAQATFGKTTGALGSLISAGDNVVRIAAFDNEVAMYTKALMKQGDVTPEMKAQIAKDAAARVRAMMPTYSEAPQAAHSLRRNILVSSFPLYPAEVYRNTMNILGQIGDEYKMFKETGNPEWAKIAGKRLGGLVMGFMTTKAGNMGIQVGRHAMRQGASSGRDEDADYVMAQPLLPEFDRATGANIVSYDPATRRLTYVAQGNLWPVSHIIKPWETALQGRPGEQTDFGAAGRAISTGADFMEAFGGLELWLTTGHEMIQAYQQADRGGANIPQAVGAGAMEGLQEANLPAANQLYRTGESAAYAAAPWKIEEGDRRPQPLWADLTKYTGITMRVLDINNEARWKLSDIGREYGQAHSVYNRVEDNAPAAEKLKAKAQLSQTLSYVERDYNQIIKSLRHFGMKDAEIKAILANTKAPGRNLSQTVADELLATGRLIPRSSVK